MPKNQGFRRVLDESMKLLEFMKKDDHERAYEKLWQVIDMMMKFPQIQRNFTERDIQDRLFQITMYLQKNLDEITKDDLSVYLNEMFEKTFTYQFFFLARELRSFPEGFEIGYGKLLSFLKLPEEVKKYISGWWKVRYKKDKGYSRTFEEYKKRKENELYLCLEVTSFGPDKAILLASEKANRSLSVLKSVYTTHLSPLRECDYYVAERKWYGGTRVDGWQWQSHVPIYDETIHQINEIYSKEQPNELERRIKSAIDTYGMIDMTTPLEIKFLLTVISMEGLLIGYGERDYIGWKFREKVALLLGDSREWFASFLKKEPKEITEEDVNRNLVPSRMELSRKMAEVYDKRSRFAHLTVGKKKSKEEITEGDFRFVEWIYTLLLRKLLNLRLTRGLDRIEKTKENKSLNLYLEEITFASRT